MTSSTLRELDVYYMVINPLTGHVWASSGGKSKFRRPADAKSAWHQSVMKAKANGIPNVGNSIGVEPRRTLKPINRYDKRPARYIMPSLDEQDIYKIVLQKSATLTKLDKAKELLRLCASHVPWDIKDQILEFLQGE